MTITDGTKLFAYFGEKFTIEFNLPGIDDASYIPSSMEAFKEDAVTLPELNIDGYEFIGWFIDSSCTISFDSSKGITEDTTLYAGLKSLIQEWKISFEPLFDDAPVEVSNMPFDRVLTSGEALGVLNEPVATGYLFIGWYLDEDFTNALPDGYVPNKDTVIYVRFMKESFVISSGEKNYLEYHLGRDEDNPLDLFYEVRGGGIFTEDFKIECTYKGLPVEIADGGFGGKSTSFAEVQFNCNVDIDVRRIGTGAFSSVDFGESAETPYTFKIRTDVLEGTVNAIKFGYKAKEKYILDFDIGKTEGSVKMEVGGSSTSDSQVDIYIGELGGKLELDLYDTAKNDPFYDTQRTNDFSLTVNDASAGTVEVTALDSSKAAESNITLDIKNPKLNGLSLEFAKNAGERNEAWSNNLTLIINGEIADPFNKVNLYSGYKEGSTGTATFVFNDENLTNSAIRKIKVEDDPDVTARIYVPESLINNSGLTVLKNSFNSSSFIDDISKYSKQI